MNNGRFEMKLTRLLKRLTNRKNHSSGLEPLVSAANLASHPSLFSSSSSSSSSSIISTPIFYVNGSPHLGHAHSAVLADALHRWSLLKGVASPASSIFSTGTDEHGVKVAQAAQRFEMTPIELCDTKSSEFRSLFDLLGVEYTDFVRTTEGRHRSAVDTFWRTLSVNGYIYKGSYAGWYSIVEEAYLPPYVKVEECPESRGNFICSESKNSVEWNEEENYLFRLTDFKEPLKKWLVENEVIQPSSFLQWVLTDLEGIQKDLSVSRSRTRLTWGHPVPNDDTQTVYVWLDALVNYLTVAGYPKSHTRYWKNVTHVIGKDILKFHAIYWPAFLMAADLPLPSKIIVHAHWLVENRKMSKSLNNVVDPKEIVDLVSADGLRYFLLAGATSELDNNYAKKKLLELLNAELCNTLGNLLNRVVGKSLNPHQYFPIPTLEAYKDFKNPYFDSLVEYVSTLPARVDEAFATLRIDRGADYIMATLREGNKFLQSATPWKMDPNSEAEQIKVILYVILETIRVCGILLLPIVPGLSGKMLDVLNISHEHRNWVDLSHDRRPFYQVTPRDNYEVLTSSFVDLALDTRHQLPLYPRLRA